MYGATQARQVGTQEAGVSKDRRPPVPEAAGMPQGGRDPVGVAGDGRKIAIRCSRRRDAES